MSKGENIFKRKDGRWEARYKRPRAVRKDNIWLLLRENLPRGKGKGDKAPRVGETRRADGHGTTHDLRVKRRMA